jgi:hypothetical protein
MKPREKGSGKLKKVKGCRKKGMIKTMFGRYKDTE